MTETRKSGSHTTVADDSGPAQDAAKSLSARLDAQARRIEALAAARENDQREVARLRAELNLVSAERDRLRKELTRVDSMQTETLALDEDWDAATTQASLTSIDELMTSFSGAESATTPSHSTLRAEAEPDLPDEFQEMISPAAIVLGSGNYPRLPATVRLLVLLDDDKRTRFVLDDELLTIGRSDSADIKITDGSMSRIHARILRIGMDSVIEDAGSKNGIRINGEPVERHVLAHGDLVQTGSVRLRYLDSACIDRRAD